MVSIPAYQVTNLFVKLSYLWDFGAFKQMRKSLDLRPHSIIIVSQLMSSSLEILRFLANKCADQFILLSEFVELTREFLCTFTLLRLNLTLYRLHIKDAFGATIFLDR